ncbi:C-type lectin domain family 12 member A-like [Orycteropus afer afer]|uniref:C-type lectin domain family 12 member A-like n=1 Tax=Orycteropus afer afer TaxID=1230840 RepID=A0A8B6ZIB0_ORYAF|nr:C-type lectin domain family 12 member A-like [Orycteropus afer afer]
MSEEVTYADLNFQYSSKTKNIQESDNLEKKAPSTPSQLWCQMTLALTLLCLLLLIGLGILGSIYYRTMKIQMEKLNNLKNIKYDLQTNISLQQTSIMNLSITLQNMATELCREILKSQKEHKCKPCPENWKWHENTCYGLSDGTETWQNSERICSAQNASLLKIKSQSVLNFIKLQIQSTYWVGLSPQKDNKEWSELDDRILSSDWFTGNVKHLNYGMYCGCIDKAYVHYKYCTSAKKFICEKLANTVKIETYFAYPTMSEEVTLADLKFQYPRKTETIQEFDNLKKKVYNLMTAITIIDCATLPLIKFLSILKIEMGKLNRLQDIKEELQRIHFTTGDQHGLLHHIAAKYSHKIMS